MRFVAALYDMLFMDVILLFVRFLWLFFIIASLQSTFVYVLLLSIILYVGLEFLNILTAGLLSSRKEDLRKAYLAPVVVLFYRPVHAAVRVKAYVDWLLKKQSRW
ncbi:MAG: hypothetical protein ACPLOC_06145 [Candidatus Bathyarchaeales archaeon]